ncbi:MAG: PAS domain-containing protein [Kineosporiaceae bacterium]|nr:PAS domain-containing protein [Kineosporiaceae bacterium]MBK8077376.1 PAS domain-containing protein [Kineosporiaceae bacterium]
MVAATAMSATVSAPPMRRRGLARWRLPELLACTGIALAGAWPGTPLSSTHLIMVTACLVPLGVRTLLRLEEALIIPAPAAFYTDLGRTDYRTVFDHTRTALAVLDVDASGEARIHRANPAFTDILGPVITPVDGEPARLDPQRVFAAADAVRLAQALAALHAAELTTWDGELSDDQGEAVRVGLVRLPGADAATARAVVRLGVSLVPLATRPSPQTPDAADPTPLPQAS